MDLNEEFERFKRFHAEQYKEIALQVTQLKELVSHTNLQPSLSIKSQDFLSKQVDTLLKKIQFLEVELLKIKKHLGLDKNG